MSPRRILAILTKDLKDAGRDGRIIVLLVLPIALALFYNATIDESDTLPETRIAVVSQDGRVAEELQRLSGRSVDLEIRRAGDAAAAQSLVADDDVSVAVVVAPPQDGPARAEVLVNAEATPTAQGVVALVPDALTRAAGREPTAQVQVRAVALTDQKPYQVVDQRAVTVLIMVLLLIAFVAMMVVPIQTAEELETGTFSALRLAATGPEILAAKALSGVLLGAVGVVLTVVLTDLRVADPLLFYGAALALAISLTGFGLLMGLLMPNSNAINTYAAFLLMPLVGLAAAVFFVEGGIFATVLDLLPFSQAAKLLGNGMSEERPFDAGALSWLVVVAWAVVGYAVLARITTRREL